MKILDRMAAKAVSSWEWAIGTDVNVDLLNGEAIDEAFESVREAIADDLDNSQESRNPWPFEAICQEACSRTSGRRSKRHWGDGRF